RALHVILRSACLSFLTLPSSTFLQLVEQSPARHTVRRKAFHLLKVLDRGARPAAEGAVGRAAIESDPRQFTLDLADQGGIVFGLGRRRRFRRRGRRGRSEALNLLALRVHALREGVVILLLDGQRRVLGIVGGNTGADGSAGRGPGPGIA